MSIAINHTSVLCNAIIAQAVEDFRNSRYLAKKGNTHQRRHEAAEMLKDCTDFFLSDYFHLLTNIDGQQLLNSLMEEPYDIAITTEFKYF